MTAAKSRARRKDAPAGSSSLVVRSNYDPDHRVVAVTGARSFLGESLLRKLEEDRRYVKVLAIDLRRPQQHPVASPAAVGGLSVVQPLLPIPTMEKVLARAMSRGGDFAEVYVERAVTTAVMLEERKVKSAQTGFEVAWPATQVALLRVVSTFGDSETSEGSVCEIVAGAVDKAAQGRLFVTEAKKGVQP